MSKPEINVTPLIDVLLVLLIIFMVITPVKPSKFEARIPSEPKADGSITDPLTIVVAVSQNSSLELNRQPMDATIASPEAVVEKLKEVFRHRERNLEQQKTVFIKAPTKLDYGSVVKLIDALKMAGASPISLQIDDLN